MTLSETDDDDEDDDEDDEDEAIDDEKVKERGTAVAEAEPSQEISAMVCWGIGWSRGLF